MSTGKNCAFRAVPPPFGIPIRHARERRPLRSRTPPVPFLLGIGGAPARHIEGKNPERFIAFFLVDEHLHSPYLPLQFLFRIFALHNNKGVQSLFKTSLF